MRLKNPSQYDLIQFRKSLKKGKKYDAILRNKATLQLKYIPFGDVRYEQYKDKVPLHLYRSVDHNDPVRRERYRARHKGEELYKYSSGWFSWYYLW